MTASIVIRNTSDDAINSIDFGVLSAGETSSVIQIRLYNAGDAAPTEIAVGAVTTQWGWSGDRNSQGQEAITEKWLQARVGTAAYAAIGGNPLSSGATLAITAMSAGGSVDVDLKLVTVTSASTAGGFSIIPFAIYGVES